MKKTAYLAAVVLCGVLIVLLVLSMVLPPLFQSQNQEKLVGDWFCDAFNGNGGKYVTFTKDGKVTLYEEITAADGTLVTQDSASFGTMTYEVLRNGKLRLTVNVMGVSSSETCDFSIKGDTLILGEDVYTRR